jgi:hypothetical protein
VLWNSGASLEFMWVSGSRDNALFGVGIQTGFSFRVNPYTSIDLNGLLKFPFGTTRYNNNFGDIQSYWPLKGGVELAFTFWTPYRSKREMRK